MAALHLLFAELIRFGWLVLLIALIVGVVATVRRGVRGAGTDTRAAGGRLRLRTWLKAGMLSVWLILAMLVASTF